MHPTIEPASPLPWELSPCGEYILANGPNLDEPLDVCTMSMVNPHDDNEMAQNAAYIVTACNAYPTLLRQNAQLREALDELQKSVMAYGDVTAHKGLKSAMLKARALLESIPS